MMTDTLDAARGLAQRGFDVFPVKFNGKTPAIKNWQSRATHDPNEVESIWPQGECNVGIKTGGGLLALDFDAKDGGLDTYEFLQQLGLPDSYTQRTQSGGVHVLLRLPEGIAAPTNARQYTDLPGLDLRGDGGLIVAAGSKVGGRPYTIENDAPVATAPTWLIKQLRLDNPKPRPKANGDARALDMEMDTPHAIETATRWLKDEAPGAVEGGAGDHTTFKVAAHVRDLGLSEDKAFDLLAEFWNPQKASPPWGLTDLRDKVRNAYAYAKRPQGGDSALHQFDEVPATDEPLAGYSTQWLEQFDPAKLPKRHWIAGNYLARGFVTSLIAPPGAGKTTFELMLALSLATGRDLTGIGKIERTRTFLWNQEDDLDEIKRRLAAIMQAFKITWADTTQDGKSMLLIGSGTDKPMIIAGKNPDTGQILKGKAARELLERFVQDGIGAAFFDPFVELHQADENDNTQISAVGRVFRWLAVQGNVSVLIVHHTRKPPAASSHGYFGDMDASRGGGSLTGVTRMGATLYTIDDATAKAYGIGLAEKHMYVRFDMGKNNMGLAGGEPHILRRESVNIRTIEDPEEVGVLRPVELKREQSVAERKEKELAAAILAVLPEGSKMRVSQLADIIVAEDIAYADAKSDTVRRNVARLVEQGYLNNVSLFKGSALRGKGVGLWVERAAGGACADSADSADRGFSERPSGQKNAAETVS
jgi:RecA-family ATPase